MGTMTKIVLVGTAMLVGGYFIMPAREKSDWEKELDVRIKAAWSACKVQYPQEKGDDFANCVGNIIGPFVFSANRK